MWRTDTVRIMNHVSETVKVVRGADTLAEYQVYDNSLGQRMGGGDS